MTGSPPLPLVFVNAANPSHSFLDAGGRTIRYADATLQPIVFAGSGGLRVNAVVLRSDGEIVTDLVREKGTHEKGVVEQGKQRKDGDGNLLFLTEDLQVTTVDTGVPVIVAPGSAVPSGTVMYVCINANGDRVLNATSSCTGLRPSIVTAMTDPSAQFVYLDAQGNKTFSAADANGFPNHKSFVTDFISGTPLFVDTHGLRSDFSPTTLVFDNAGADITVYALASEAVDFSRISVQVSTNGTTWHSTTALATAVRVPGDGGHPLDHTKSYDIGDNTGIQYKYIRIVGSGDFKLDALGIVAGHGGVENSSLATDFPTVVIASLTTVPTSRGRRRRRRAERRLHAAPEPHAHVRLERARPAGADPRQPRRQRPVHAHHGRPRLVRGRQRPAPRQRVARLGHRRHARLGAARARPDRHL